MMKKKQEEPYIDAGQWESEIYEPPAEVKEEFAEAARQYAANEPLAAKVRHQQGAEISGGDVDAAWDDLEVGEEAVGGGNPTPDQNVVEELGESMGLEYNDDEPLGTEEKLKKRDRHRWELDPASSDDFAERT